MISRATQACGSLLGVLLANILWCQPVFADPSTGAYSADSQNEWVQDYVLENISTVNMIMCFMGNLRPDAKVNAGPYLALVDEGKCNGRGASDTSGSAGASAAVNYAKAIVDSTRASNSVPMLVKAWVRPQSGSELIFTYTSVTEARSDTTPNGVFTMDFCGVSASSSTPLTDSCQFNGTFTSQGSTITFYESGLTAMGGSYSNALTLTQSGTTSGSGRLQGSGGQSSFDQVFSYDATYFQRGDTNTPATYACFDRRTNLASTSTWRYGVYNNDGSRLELTNPGFPVTYSSGGHTYYGYAGFYGIYLPDSVLSGLSSGATLVKRDPSTNSSTEYTLTKVGGKLTRLTKQEATLGAVKGQTARVWLSDGEAEISWDGSTLSKVRTFSNGSSSPCSSACTLSAPTLGQNLGQKVLMGYSESAGGEIAITVPGSGDFSDSTPLYYRTRTVVSPADQPASLKCISRCPKGSLTSSDFSNRNISQHTIIDPDRGPFELGWTNGNFGNPIVKNSDSWYARALSYSFSSGMMVNGNGTPGNVDASSLSLSNTGYQYGLQSGRLIAPSDTTSYGEASCNSDGTANSSGDYLCPWLLDAAAVVYQWETGPKAWNQYMGLSAGGTIVTFDPPTIIPFTPTTTNTSLASGSSLIGSTVNLQYAGFGDLHGIPGACVNPATNAEVNCGDSLGGDLQMRYVPKFSITDGTSLTVNSSIKWMKYLDREVRFLKYGRPDNCSGLTMPTSSTTLPSTNNDPRLSTGAEPSLSTAVPAVIHGVVQ